jgi:predicted CoA-substrate-specific enzyme activase
MCCARPKLTPRWPGQVRAGLDLGSRVAKLVVAGPEGIIKQSLMDSVPLLAGLGANGSLPYEQLDLSPDIPLVLTGYGKAALPGLCSISEIRAHYRGALAQTGLRDFTLVELGGQDSKVVQVESGKALDFNTNDRCAAGTGRYLENMARLLGVELAELAASQSDPVQITNTCAIFGETEILSHIVEGRTPGQVMAGVNWSVARRIRQMVHRYHPQLLVFCGGVALNQAVVKLTEAETGCPVVLPGYPQLNGAIGCIMEKEQL